MMDDGQINDMPMRHWRVLASLVLTALAHDRNRRQHCCVLVRSTGLCAGAADLAGERQDQYHQPEQVGAASESLKQGVLQKAVLF
jgi:hypothetical protein